MTENLVPMNTLTAYKRATPRVRTVPFSQKFISTKHFSNLMCHPDKAMNLPSNCNASSKNLSFCVRMRSEMEAPWRLLSQICDSLYGTFWHLQDPACLLYFINHIICMSHAVLNSKPYVHAVMEHITPFWIGYLIPAGVLVLAKVLMFQFTGFTS